MKHLLISIYLLLLSSIAVGAESDLYSSKSIIPCVVNVKEGVTKEGIAKDIKSSCSRNDLVTFVGKEPTLDNVRSFACIAGTDYWNDRKTKLTCNIE